MKSGLIILGVFAFVGLMLAMWFMGTYNNLVTQSESVDTQWAAVEAQYERRFALVPNLVAATKGALRQEQEVFGAIAEARTRYAGAPAGSNERVQAAGQYESALARLMVIVENYPVLLSNRTVSDLMSELTGTENRVLVARDRYNEEVRKYNLIVKRFPGNLLAGLFGFEEREFFEATEGSQTAPTVDLNLE